MTPREYLARYIHDNGGVPATALKLGIPYSSLAAISNGNRGIGKDLADRMCRADPLLDRNRLVWVRPLPREQRQPQAASA